MHSRTLAVPSRRSANGAVYAAVHRETNRPAAIREFLPSRLVRRARDGNVERLDGVDEVSLRRALQRFVADAQIMVELDHPNIVRAHDVLAEHGTAYLVMDLVYGQRLSEALKLMRLSGEGQLRQLMDQLADAIGTIHDAGVVHGGLQPEHVLLGSDDTPILLDIAGPRIAISTTSDGVSLRTLADGYAAPEQYLSNQWTSATDLYGLGAVMYRAVAGEPPTSAPERETLQLNGNRMRSALETGGGLFSGRFLRAIDSSLILEPSRRVQNVAELRTRLTDGAIAAEPDLESATTLELGPILPAVAGSEVDEVFLEAFRGRLESGNRPELVRRIGERGNTGSSTRRGPLIAIACVGAVVAALFFGNADEILWTPADGSTPLGAEENPSRGVDPLTAPAAALSADALTTPGSASPSTASSPAGAHSQATQKSSLVPDADRLLTPAPGGATRSEGQSGVATSASDEARKTASVVTASTPAAKAPLSPQDESRLVDGLARVEVDIAADRLKSPAGNNAYERLRELAVIAPGDTRIEAANEAIALRYIELARREATRGNNSRARTFIDRAASVAPQLKALAAARQALLKP
jgi:serine/threonine protein kinase